jgi:hypothetical protein
MSRYAALFVTMLLAAACTSKDAAPAAEGGAAAAPAASSGGGDDLADVTRYELTMDKIDKYYAAQRNIALKAKAMSPAEREAMKASSDAGDDGASLEDMARKIETNPVLSSSVREAGLSAREFSTITMAMLQAAMASSVLQMRPNDNQDSLAREMKANPANIRFMKENERALTQKQTEFQAEMKRLGVGEEG